MNTKPKKVLAIYRDYLSYERGTPIRVKSLLKEVSKDKKIELYTASRDENLTALMILFINLVTSTFPALALSVESTHIKVMKQKPRNPDEKILSHYILLKIFVLVPLLFLGTLALFLWELNIGGGGIEKARTVAFVTLIMFELMHTFNARSLHTTIFNKNFFSNKYIFIAVGTSMTLTILTIYTSIGQRIFNTIPLSILEWMTITLVSSLVIILAETIKALIKSEFKEQKRLKGLEIQVE